jgi:hypothetical protein
MSAEDPGERVQKQVQVDRLGEDGEDAHAQGLVEQVVGQVIGQEDAGRREFEVAHLLDDLEAAELGHLVVEDGDVDLRVADHVEGLASGADRDGVDALGFEQAAHGVLPFLALVCEEDAEAILWDGGGHGRSISVRGAVR